MKRETKRAALIGLAAGLLVVGICNGCKLIRLRTATGETLPVEEPGEGVGRNLSAYRYLSGPEAEEIGTAVWLDTYTEGDGPAPEWYRPGEPMSAEWFAGDMNVTRRDLGCPDYSFEAEVVPEWVLDVPLDRWFQEYLHGLCEAEGVPYLLAVAVIEAESGYDPSAVSVCGDYGLMQINEICHGLAGSMAECAGWGAPARGILAGLRRGIRDAHGLQHGAGGGGGAVPAGDLFHRLLGPGHGDPGETGGEEWLI